MSNGRAAGALGSLITPQEPQQIDVEDVAGKPIQPAAARSKLEAPRQPKEKQRAGGRAGKNGNAAFHKLTVYIPQETRKTVGIKLLQQGGPDMSELVSQLLDGWTAGRLDV